MHLCSCLVSLAGDPSQKAYKKLVSVPEIALLRQIHGQDAVTEIRIVAQEPRDQNTEAGRLKAAYPKYAQMVTDMWRDYGARLPSDLRDLNLDSAFMHVERKSTFDIADDWEKGNVNETQVGASGSKKEKILDELDEEVPEKATTKEDGTLVFQD